MLGAEAADDGVLKVGTLTKASQTRKGNSNPGPFRQRKFRITSDAIEYKQLFSHVSITCVIKLYITYSWF